MRLPGDSQIACQDPIVVWVSFRYASWINAL